MADTAWFDMENEIKPFDESTLADAKLVGGNPAKFIKMRVLKDAE